MLNVKVTAYTINEWADFFEKLGTPFNDGACRSSSTTTKHRHIIRQDNSLLADIVTLKVEEAINSLALNKVLGPDNIQSEHLKHGDMTIIFHLTQPFNLPVKCMYVPQSLKHDIIPVPKMRTPQTQQNIMVSKTKVHSERRHAWRRVSFS